MATPAGTAPVRLRLEQRIASGGMAEVYRAVLLGSAGFEKPSVVKRIRKELQGDGEMQRLFVREARLWAGLSHPNIVSALHFGEEEGQFYLALEYVDGLDLARVLRAKGRLEPSLALYIVACVLRALDYVHQHRGAGGEAHGLVHRDVSPHNILLSRTGEVKLSDFGVAKPASRRLDSQPGTFVGKVAYMSPEQARHEVLDGRTDLFSLGLVAWEALLGSLPFLGDAEELVLAARARGEHAALEGLGDDALPEGLIQVLRRAVAPDRAARYASAAQLLEALQPWLDESVGPSRVAALVESLEPSPLASHRAPEAARPHGFSAAARELFGGSEPEPEPEDPSRTITAPELAATVVSRPGAKTLSSGSPPHALESTARLADAPTQLGRSRRRWAASLVAVAVVGAVAVALVVERPREAPPAPAPVAEVPRVSASAPRAPLAEPAPAAVEAAAPSPVASAPEPGPAQAPPAEATVEKARLTVNSTPWAQVTVNGTYRGNTPLQGLVVEAGRQELVLRNPHSGQKKRLTLTLKPGEHRVVPVDLAEKEPTR